jgi:hypothetical protein
VSDHFGFAAVGAPGRVLVPGDATT